MTIEHRETFDTTHKRTANRTDITVVAHSLANSCTMRECNEEIISLS